MKKHAEKTTKTTAKKTSKRALVIEKPKRMRDAIDFGAPGCPMVSVPDTTPVAPEAILDAQAGVAARAVDDGEALVADSTWGPPHIDDANAQQEIVVGDEVTLDDGTTIPLEKAHERGGMEDSDAAPAPALCTFAFRLTPAERDEIHAAAGKGGASKFVKAVALAVARGDSKAVQAHLDRVLSAINDRIVAEQQAR